MAVGGTKMKRITLDKLTGKQEKASYQTQYDHIMSLIREGRIKPVAASGKNGKKPALYLEYWITEPEEEQKERLERLRLLKEELEYGLSPAIGIDYYVSHPEVYEAERSWVLMMDRYLKNCREKLRTEESMNERSFEIWGREKFLKEEQGKTVCRHMGISMEMLNIYDTSEPLAYYSHTKKVPQNLLIIENKDTFYTMRRHLISGGGPIFGLETGTLIYGAGKQILRSFRDFSLCMEPYITNSGNKIYYFGDLDYEGISIYEDLCGRFGREWVIEPFKAAYIAMTEKVLNTLTVQDSLDSGLCSLPGMKEKQSRRGGDLFFGYFEAAEQEKMKAVLLAGKYIPQECLTISDLPMRPGDYDGT